MLNSANVLIMSKYAIYCFEPICYKIIIQLIKLEYLSRNCKEIIYLTYMSAKKCTQMDLYVIDVTFYKNVRIFLFSAVDN